MQDQRSPRRKQNEQGRLFSHRRSSYPNPLSFSLALLFDGDRMVKVPFASSAAQQLLNEQGIQIFAGDTHILRYLPDYKVYRWVPVEPVWAVAEHGGATPRVQEMSYEDLLNYGLCV